MSYHDENKKAEANRELEEPNEAEQKDLNEKDLDKVSGGAFPTAVNNQITDSVTET